MTIQSIKKKIVPVLKRQGVTKAALFGSFARGDTKKRSDIDILIKLSGKKSLLDLVRIQFMLEDKLGKKVDLVEYGAIKPNLRDIILSEQKIIYEQKRS